LKQGNFSSAPGAAEPRITAETNTRLGYCIGNCSDIELLAALGNFSARQNYSFGASLCCVDILWRLIRAFFTTLQKSMDHVCRTRRLVRKQLRISSQQSGGDVAIRSR